MNTYYPQTITKIYGVTSTTLRNWAEAGKIKCIRPLGRRRLYNKEDVRIIFGQTEDPDTSQIKVRKRILYARVSSLHQTEDLSRQISFLQSKYPNCQLIKDIGSGLNWKRKGLETILEQIHKGDIEEIVVAYKDRLCRFGYELFEWICQKHDTKIAVLNKVSETEDRTKELAEDLLSPSLLLKTTDSVYPKTDKFGIKVRKIKMLPNPEQKIKLIRWFGIYRFIYNKGLEILKNDSYIHGSSLIQQLRDRLIKNENYDSEKGNEWVKQLPADTRDNAIRELLHAFRNNLKSGHKFNMTFKTLTKY
jgi:predicted site-specific integrase-resolvase